MKKFAHEVQVGDKIDWYGHGEFMESGLVLEKSYENGSNIVVFKINDPMTSDKPFILKKSKYNSIFIHRPASSV